MEKMGQSVGLAIGVALGLVVAIIILKAINKDGKMITKYDEMQEKARGKAYKYAFWTVIGLEAIMAIIRSGVDEIPIEDLLVHFIIIVLGIMVQVTYAIWHDAYVGINTNPQKYAIFAILISVINLFFGGMAIASGRMIVDGVLRFPFGNIICGLIFVIIGVEVFIKNYIDKKARD